MAKQKVFQILKLVAYVLIDIIAIGTVYLMAFFLYKMLRPNESVTPYLKYVAIIIVFKIIVFYICGFYKLLMKYVSFEDIFKIIIVISATNVFIVLVIYLLKLDFIHLTFFFFTSAAEIAFILLPRSVGRISKYFKIYSPFSEKQGKNTLIIGAGSAGELAIREIQRLDNACNNVIAFIDDDYKKIGKNLLGIPIKGGLDDILKYVNRYNIEEVIIAIKELSSPKIQNIIDILSSKRVKVKRLYYIDEINNKMAIQDVKLEDLLNREEIRLDNSLLKDFIKDEIVLVTGGGGSIGSELSRQIAELNPKKLIIFDIYENNAYDIQMELQNKLLAKLKVYIGSVYNKIRLEEVFKLEKPTIVFHAAAYKHVPLMEDNSIEAIRTNVLGTHYLSELSLKYKVKKFVLVSSDKAVRPKNMMGATKRFAELIVKKANDKSSTSFSAVRFGNVLGSNGSVVPLFKKQIEAGGPLTLTDEKVIRYFMTITEAVSLILQSAVYAKGGEIFVLDMGEPVLIKDLAEKMIKLSGYEPYRDIDIKVIGLRPGEKLYEELLVDPNSSHIKTDNKKIFIEETNNDNNIDLEDIISKINDLDNEKAKALVKSYIKSYK